MEQASLTFLRWVLGRASNGRMRGTLLFLGCPKIATGFLQFVSPGTSPSLHPSQRPKSPPSLHCWLSTLKKLAAADHRPWADPGLEGAWRSNNRVERGALDRGRNDSKLSQSHLLKLTCSTRRISLRPFLLFELVPTSYLFQVITSILSFEDPSNDLFSARNDAASGLFSASTFLLLELAQIVLSSSARILSLVRTVRCSLSLARLMEASFPLVRRLNLD